MATIYTTYFRVLVMITVKIICVFGKDGLLCYNCDLLPHQRDCSRIVECGLHESCYGEHYVTTGGVELFRSGCKANSTCLSKKKKSDNTLCKSCCHDNYCNLQTCDIPKKLERRCLACDDVIDPRLCTRSVQCDADQMCFAEQIYNANKERRYRLGCVIKKNCGLINPVPIGKRDNSNTRQTGALHNYCAQCCDSGENCNRNLCQTGSVSLDLILPPPLQFCFDSDTTYCTDLFAKDASSCGNRVFRYFMCPRTCGICSGAAGVGILPTTTQTVSASTTPSGGQCPNLFELQRCQVIDCAISLCDDPDLRPLCVEYCNGNCLPKDCSQTKFHNK